MNERQARAMAIGGLIGAVLAVGVTLWSNLGAQETADMGTTAQVQSVHDGDTFRIPEGSVRVLGIDTPEIPDDCYGPEATAMTRDLLLGSEVVLTQDPKQGDTDHYGRLLRYVMTDTGEDLGAYLLRYGYARVYEEYPVSRTPEYLRLQQTAQQEQRGLWKDCR